jgi:hypothetical protein
MCAVTAVAKDGQGFVTQRVGDETVTTWIAVTCIEGYRVVLTTNKYGHSSFQLLKYNSYLERGIPVECTR